MKHTQFLLSICVGNKRARLVIRKLRLLFTYWVRKTIDGKDVSRGEAALQQIKQHRLTCWALAFFFAAFFSLQGRLHARLLEWIMVFVCVIFIALMRMYIEIQIKVHKQALACLEKERKKILLPFWDKECGQTYSYPFQDHIVNLQWVQGLKKWRATCPDFPVYTLEGASRSEAFYQYGRFLTSREQK